VRNVQKTKRSKILHAVGVLESKAAMKEKRIPSAWKLKAPLAGT
jgi:hypothetical protein